MRPTPNINMRNWNSAKVRIGDAILGTERYFDAIIKVLSFLLGLRRGDFRYTSILRYNGTRASEDWMEFAETSCAEFKDAESRFGFGKVWKNCERPN